MKRLVPFSLAALVLATSGCHIFAWRKKPATPKPSMALASDVEKDFMHRWIEKRTAELVSQGRGPLEAHDQAVADYKQAFAFTRTVGQAN
jgi:hypothetical protein